MPSVGNWAYVFKCKVAVAGARRLGDPLARAHAVRHLGDAWCYAGRPSLAEPCYVEALSIYRRSERTTPLDLANAVRSYAVLNDTIGAAAEAKRLWQEAHDLYVTLDTTAGIAESAARLALHARREGDVERSRACLAEAGAAADAAGDPETSQYVREVREEVEPAPMKRD